MGFDKEDVSNLPLVMQNLLKLQCGSMRDLHLWRKKELRKKMQLDAYDYYSPPVRIAMLTEKILHLRRHLLHYPGQRAAMDALRLRLKRRHRLMKALYQSDFALYEWVCKELNIKCVRFAIPNNPDVPSQAISPVAVDGNYVQWLVRQKLFKWKHRPKPVRRASRLIGFKRHPIEPVPEGHGEPQPVKQKVSRAWPYGVKEEYVQGIYKVWNPTAPGKGHQTPPLA
jgi:small subunit ribosomal protein S15